MGNSRKFSNFENENEGKIYPRIFWGWFSKILEFREWEWGQYISENFLRVILENSQNSRMRTRVTFSRVLASLVPTIDKLMARKQKMWFYHRECVYIGIMLWGMYLFFHGCICSKLTCIGCCIGHIETRAIKILYCFM